MPAALPGLQQHHGSILHGRSPVAMAAFSLGKSLLKSKNFEHGRRLALREKRKKKA